MNKLNSQDLCFALRKCYNIVSKYYNINLIPIGITFAQLSLMMEIEENARLNLTELSTVMGINRTSINRNNNILVKYGYIKTVTSEDKRAKFLKLTPEGRGVMKKGMGVLELVQRKVNNNIESLIKLPVLYKDLESVGEMIGGLR